MSILTQKFIELNKGKLKHTYNLTIIRYKDNRLSFEDFVSVGGNPEFYNPFKNAEVIYQPIKKDIFVNMESKTFGKKGTCEDEKKIKVMQKFSAMRAKTRIKRLILNNNLWNHCGTTYARAEEGINREKVLYDNKKFMQRLAYQQKKKIPYVSVPEIQPGRYEKTGLKVYHMHNALDFNISEREYFSAWNSFKCLNCKKFELKNTNFQCGDCSAFVGLVWVKKEKDYNLERGANYFAKYFSKGFDDEDLNQRTFSEKRYLCSKGLVMPPKEQIRIDDLELIEKIKKASGYNKEFDDGGYFSSIHENVLDMILGGEI
jgi:hypothetical protein